MTSLFPYHPPPSTGSIRSVTLLTPPESPTLHTDTPFKPKDDDTTSLSMKRGHHGHRFSKAKITNRRKLNRACLSSEELRPAPPKVTKAPSPYRSKSLPSVATSTMSIAALSTRFPIKTTGTGSPDQRRRRWTLPSKAAPTRSRAVTINAEHKPPLTTLPQATGLLSPAMITLRRATTVRPTLDTKKMSLTFFPEPQFERSRTGFLAAFLKSMTGISGKENGPSWPRVETRRTSISSEGARPSRRGSASPVCTRVTDVQPTFSQPSGNTYQNTCGPPRRCSTKYITGDHVYEVIWDENLKSSSESTSIVHAEHEARPADDRRRSVAMKLLETQLQKANAQSRRQSQILEEQERRSSHDSQYERERQGSLQSILGFKLSRFVNEASLQDLPRSKSSKLDKGKSPANTSRISSITIPEKVPEHSECDQPRCSIEFFPPLISRATTAASKPDLHTPESNSKSTSKSTSKSITPPQGRPRASLSHTSPFGSMIGVSSHAKRRSIALVHGGGRKRSDALVQSRSASMGIPRTKTTIEDENTPLLSNVGRSE